MQLETDFGIWCRQGQNAKELSEISDKLTQSVKQIGLYKGSELSSRRLIQRQQGEISFLINYIDSISGMANRPTP